MNRSSQEIYDELLVLRCQQLDLAAWDELVSRWSGRLLYYVRRLIDHEHDALNVLQEVWVQAFRSMRLLRSGARLAPWLYTIARRSAMNHFRREYGRPQEVGAAQVLDEVQVTFDATVRFENAELVHYGLRRIGLPERELLTLFFLQDLSINEIAQLLDIPAGTVKSRLFKARQDLKRVLEQEAHRHEP